nr:hypothetical protein [Tanacetum cinerariifolium]
MHLRGVFYSVESLQSLQQKNKSDHGIYSCQFRRNASNGVSTTSNELDLLFSPMFDELLNGSTKVVSKSSAVSAADAPNQRQQPTTPLNNHTTPAPSCQTPTITPSVISSENINQAEPHVENDEVAEDEFINIFSTPVQDQGETSKNKEGAGMKIPDWILIDEIKQTDHYKMYAAIFLVDVLTTQSQPIESTEGTYSITNASRTPNLAITGGESSAQRKSTVTRLRVPPRRKDPETPIPTAAEIDNVAKVKEHMVDEELDQMLEGVENVDMDAFTDDVLNSQEDLDTRI